MLQPRDPRLTDVQLLRDLALGKPLLPPDLRQPVSLDRTFTHHRHGDVTLRWLYVHMISEYAGHIGHADLIRQRIDGLTFG